MDIIFHSQFGEDKFLFDNGHIKKHGFYLDVGAGRPEELSNTRFLDYLGWDGLCVDPDPRNAHEFSNTDRKFLNIAVGSKKTMMFSMNSNPTLTRESDIELPPERGFSRKCSRLSELVDKDIDLLSLDVEGNEIDVLNTMDGMKPKIIIVEFLTLKIGSSEDELISFFKDTNYKLIFKTRANLIFKLF